MGTEFHDSGAERDADGVPQGRPFVGAEDLVGARQSALSTGSLLPRRLQTTPGRRPTGVSRKGSGVNSTRKDTHETRDGAGGRGYDTEGLLQ